MATWYYVQIKWCGTPTAEQIAEANRVLSEIDSDAPRLDAEGYDGEWREPVGDLRCGTGISAVLDSVFPCKVRVGAPYYGRGEWDEKSAKEVCKSSGWIWSCPLFKDGVATRYGTLDVVCDDGKPVTEVVVTEGEKLSDVMSRLALRFS